MQVVYSDKLKAYMRRRGRADIAIESFTGSS